ncbi:uncharacterized protein LOC121596132 isoform X2 [Anopheles merus]|uniref:uncharacterized protein LOC121596132 isoform X2 n=1 Tax=Anopheles merus TaxID=30066 RepID=UPI001BE49189|nr:uncharacterized protein LOC121596132 isoform X2 [Anopheles merus]
MNIEPRCNLNDLLDTENNPTVLDRICEGEQVQTAEFYNQQEKSYHRNVAKIYRKNRAVSPGPPTVNPAPPPPPPPPPAVPAIVEPAVQPIPMEGPLEPVRSNEGVNAAAAPNDPYQLRGEINAIATVMPSAVELLPQDDNFGSQEADGAREFLQLCTDEELPPMSLRQSMTRNMLLSQFPSLPAVAPMVDNFQTIDLNTPLFRRPLGTSTPFLPVTELTAQLALPELQESGPQGAQEPQQDPAAEVVPNRSGEVTASAVQPSTVPPLIPVVESSSSGEEVPVARPRRTRREVTLTQRLEPFESSTGRGMPRPRRNFDIFSFPYRTVWNKTIQDVQNQLAELYKQQQQEQQSQRKQQQELLEAVPVMREAATNQRIDSGFQQTTDDGSRNPPPMSTTETSNLAVGNRTGGKATISNDPSHHVLSQQEAIMTSDLVGTSLQPVAPDQLESIDGKLAEASDRFQLPTVLGDTPAANNETSVMKIPAQADNVSVSQETEKQAVPSDPPLTAPQEQRTTKRTRSNKQNEEEQAVSSEQRPEKPSEIRNEKEIDLSSVLFNQAKELEAIPEEIDSCAELAPLDTMLIDIVLVVQREMCHRGVQYVPLHHLHQFFRTSSRLGVCKLFKNIILLKQAGLLEVQCNEENHIRQVTLRNAAGWSG